MHSRKQQTGLSLIELMVAMAIGVFLILGVSQIYVDNKRSYVFQQGQAENQEGSRYALLLLQQELNKAGYRRRPDETMSEAFPADSSLTGCSFSAGQSVLWNNTTSSLCIRYQPRVADDRDCLGNTIAGVPAEPYKEAPGLFIERFYIDGDALMCASNTNASPGELMSGIADLRLEFGLATNTSPRQLDRYVAADAVASDIVALRYIGLMRSSTGWLRDIGGDSPTLNAWQAMTEATAAEREAITDEDNGQLYQISQSTIMLRNLMP